MTELDMDKHIQQSLSEVDYGFTEGVLDGILATNERLSGKGTGSSSPTLSSLPSSAKVPKKYDPSITISSSSSASSSPSSSPDTKKRPCYNPMVLSPSPSPPSSPEIL